MEGDFGCVGGSECREGLRADGCGGRGRNVLRFERYIFAHSCADPLAHSGLGFVREKMGDAECAVPVGEEIELGPDVGPIGWGRGYDGLHEAVKVHVKR